MILAVLEKKLEYQKIYEGISIIYVPAMLLWYIVYTYKNATPIRLGFHRKCHLTTSVGTY